MHHGLYRTDDGAKCVNLVVPLPERSIQMEITHQSGSGCALTLWFLIGLRERAIMGFAFAGHLSPPMTIAKFMFIQSLT